jgi:uncharacterized RDD family membrane protein YckC
VSQPQAPEWWQDRGGNWHYSPRPPDAPEGAGPPVPFAAPLACPICGGAWGRGMSCPTCGFVEGLPQGVRLASSGRRLGGYVLEILLAIVTLFIGWLVWALVVFSRGQTPAKQLLGMRVVKIREGAHATWGSMAIREFLAKPAIGLLAAFTLIGYVLYFWLLWDNDNQELWDKMVDTIVVTDPANAL